VHCRRFFRLQGDPWYNHQEKENKKCYEFRTKTKLNDTAGNVAKVWLNIKTAAKEATKKYLGCESSSGLVNLKCRTKKLKRKYRQKKEQATHNCALKF
jgi:hypothetical protein